MSSTATNERALSGVVGFYPGPNEVLKAMERVKAENYELFDAFTPYPVHGMDDAMGLKRSWLPYITFIAGLTGLTCGWLLQYWTSVVDWPLNIGGKPFHSLPAFIPVMFECTILFAAHATALTMLFVANRLPNISAKSFDPGITRDRFAIWIGAPKDAAHHDAGVSKHKRFDVQEAQRVLQGTGAQDVRTVYAEGWF